MPKYRFLKDVDYSPTDASYTEGEEADLQDWHTKHINNAVKAGLLQVLEEGVDNGRTDNSERLRRVPTRKKT